MSLKKIFATNHGIVSTYPLVYTLNKAYCGGVLDTSGNIHFIPTSNSDENINDNKIISSCLWCNSGITEYDRTCPQCGAPNVDNIKTKDIEVRGGKGNYPLYTYQSELEELKQEYNSLEEIRLLRISHGLDYADISNKLRETKDKIDTIKERR
jgi:hypothetical protein